MGVDIDELNLGWNQQLYVLVRPADGPWMDVVRGSAWRDRKLPADWRPALISGFQDEGHRDWYGRINDPRSVGLIDSTNSHRLADFEIGAIIGVAGEIDPEADLEETATPSPR